MAGDSRGEGGLLLSRIDLVLEHLHDCGLNMIFYDTLAYWLKLKRSLMAKASTAQALMMSVNRRGVNLPNLAQSLEQRRLQTVNSSAYIVLIACDLTSPSASLASCISRDIRKIENISGMIEIASQTRSAIYITTLALIVPIFSCRYHDLQTFWGNAFV